MSGCAPEAALGDAFSKLPRGAALSFCGQVLYPRSKHCFGEELFMYSNHDSGRWRVLRGILTGLNILSRLAFEGTGKKPHAFKR